MCVLVSRRDNSVKHRKTLWGGTLQRHFASWESWIIEDFFVPAGFGELWTRSKFPIDRQRHSDIFGITWLFWGTEFIPYEVVTERSKRLRYFDIWLSGSHPRFNLLGFQISHDYGLVSYCVDLITVWKVKWKWLIHKTPGKLNSKTELTVITMQVIQFQKRMFYIMTI